METREKDMKKISENEKMPQTKDVTDEIAVKSIEPDSILDSAKLVPIKDFVSPEELHKDLIQIIRKYHPSADISMVEKHIRSQRKHIRHRCANPENRISFIRYM